MEFNLAEMWEGLVDAGPDAEWQWFAQPGWASFYLATGRAWELMIGALAAFYLSSVEPEPSRIGGAAAAAGLGLIAYSIFAFDGNTPFPSVYTPRQPSARCCSSCSQMKARWWAGCFPCPFSSG